MFQADLTPRDKSSNYVFQSQFTIELRLNCVCRIFRGKKNSSVLKLKSRLKLRLKLQEKLQKKNYD